MTSKSTIRQQKGAVLVLVALSLVVLMGMAALAIDLSHAYVNKSRLQNLADALALSAAISINKQEPHDTTTDKEVYAENYAKTSTFPLFESASGNKEIADELAATDFTFTFATTLSNNPADWYAANAISDAKFVRVTMNPMNIATWFAPVLGLISGGDFSSVPVSNSAVAGTSPIVPCDLSPILMCATTNATAAEDDGDGEFDGVDKDCTDGDCYGYNLNDLYCMSGAIGSAPNHKCQVSDNAVYGAGNIGLVDFGPAFGLPSGASTIKDCLAGDEACKKFCTLPTADLDGDGIADDTVVPSKPGISAGGVVPGIGTLFNNDHPTTGYPSDKITGLGTIPNTSSAYLDYTKISTNTYLTTNVLLGGTKIPAAGIPASELSNAGITPHPYTAYQSFEGQTDDHASQPPSDVAAEDRRRILGVPMVDCTNFGNGKEANLPVVGYGCFFLSADITKNADEFFLLGAFVGDDCTGTGKPSSTNNYGFYKVQLYKDPFGGHS